ncbi:hypothetical protein GEMRC1_005361 [Eukaryota sp. GEM-RC1]
MSDYGTVVVGHSRDDYVVEDSLDMSSESDICQDLEDSMVPLQQLAIQHQQKVNYEVVDLPAQIKQPAVFKPPKPVPVKPGKPTPSKTTTETKAPAPRPKKTSPVKKVAPKQTKTSIADQRRSLEELKSNLTRQALEIVSQNHFDRIFNFILDNPGADEHKLARFIYGVIEFTQAEAVPMIIECVQVSKNIDELA